MDANLGGLPQGIYVACWLFDQSLEHGNPPGGIVAPLAWRPSGPVACRSIAGDRTAEIKCRGHSSLLAAERNEDTAVPLYRKLLSQPLRGRIVQSRCWTCRIGVDGVLSRTCHRTWREQRGATFAVCALEERGLVAQAGDRFPQQCSASDLVAASHIVALYETEHRPLMRERFSAWENRVEYWQVADVEIVPPKVALRAI